VLAGGLVLLGVIAERWFGFHLGPREWLGVGLTTLGLAFLALTGGGDSGQESADYSFAAMLAFESTLVGLGTALVLFHRANRSPPGHGVLLGVAAGLLFTVTHVAVKALIGEVDEDLAAVLVYGLVAAVAAVAAFFASARSLQIGDGVVVIALTSIASNASAIPAGIVVFGDPIGDDAVSVILRSSAFVLVVLAAAMIPGPTRAAAVPNRAAARPEVPALEPVSSRWD
jgi:drug/metabolite transporter (DMT)-like permease